MLKIMTFLLLFLALPVNAHCPLCTIGAAAVAGGAIWLGVSKAVVSMFIGAFGVLTGILFSKAIKKKYIPFQHFIIITTSFVMTIIPLRPYFKEIVPFYISFMGDYGSILNRTYLVDVSIITSLLGVIIVIWAPRLSKQLSKVRGGKMIPFQGTIITLSLLIISSSLIQFMR